MSKTPKPLPHLASDAEAERSVTDLSEFDLSGMKPVRFEACWKEKQSCWSRIADV